jgi:hypothetical protein
MEARNRVGLGLVAAWFAIVGIVPARGVTITPGPGLGGGRDSVVIAVITDVHIGGPGNDPHDYGTTGYDDNYTTDSLGNAIHLRQVVEWINANRVSQDIALVMVLGDLSASAESSELKMAKSLLDGLDVPYVPLIGNHDIWPYVDYNNQAPQIGPGLDSLFVVRYFDRLFGPQYTRLDSISIAGNGPVREWKKMPGSLYNFELDTPYCYDKFQTFSFSLGPSGCPYRFVCLDLNGRHSAAPGGPGVPGPGDVHRLSMDALASSVQLLFRDDEWGGINVYDDTGLTGNSTTITESRTDLAAIGWNNRIKSFEFCGACTCAVLHDTTNYSSGIVNAKWCKWLSRLTPEDRLLNENGSSQWWRDRVRALCEQGDQREHVIMFAHHPLEALFSDDKEDLLDFTGSEYNFIASLLNDYRRDIGMWFAGHTHLSTSWPVHESWLGGATVCYCMTTAQNEGSPSEGENIRLVTLRYNPQLQPIVDVDASGLDPSPFDAVRACSAAVRVVTDDRSNGGSITVKIRRTLGSWATRTIVSDTWLYPDSTYEFTWDGRGGDGGLAIPGEYEVGYYAGGDYMGCSPFAVKGTLASGSCAGEWSQAMDPIVLTGDVEVPAAEMLVVDSGVYVMPAGNHGMTVEGTLIAKGSPGDSGSVLFTPYRRLEPTPDSCTAGAWKGIKVVGDGLCSLDYCAIEYAGGTADSAAVFCHDSAQLVMTNSVIRHSSSRGFYGHSDRDVMNRIYGDTFEYCASYPVTISSGDTIKDYWLLSAFNVEVQRSVRQPLTVFCSRGALWVGS